MKLLSTNQAAERLGVSVRRVRALIAEGTLKAHQLGREYAIEESALSAVIVYGKPGRPSKVADDQAASPATEKKPTKSKKSRKAGSKKATKNAK